MMDDPKFLWAPTILSTFSHYGARVAVVTAKDKLRRLLGSGLDMKNGGAVCFSAEKADLTTEGEHGISRVPEQVGMKVPDVYSAELSEFVLAAGIMLLDVYKPDLMYLSTTDYIQHKHAPGTETANQFYATIDRYLGLLDQREVTVVLTADHGMNDKTRSDGRPNVVYLQTILNQQFPYLYCNVILPITDPYVVHHGSLGSYATIYIKDQSRLQQVIDFLSDLPETEEVFTGDEAAKNFELPKDRIGQVVILARKDVVFGQTPENHDLSPLDAPLRSHGGLSERQVPMVLNFAVDQSQPSLKIRNFDAFSIALNQCFP
jgi:phosphonoacetate hydrolase